MPLCQGFQGIVLMSGNKSSPSPSNKGSVMQNMKVVDIVKWLATIIQLIGYGMTGLNMVPYNIYLFFIGIFLWFAVGVMWKDKAIMVVHVGAFISLLVGYLNA